MAIKYIQWTAVAINATADKYNNMKIEETTMLSNISQPLTKIQNIVNEQLAWTTYQCFKNMVFEMSGWLSGTKMSTMAKLLVVSIACTSTSAYTTTGIAADRFVQSGQAGHGNARTSESSPPSDAGQALLPPDGRDDNSGSVTPADINTVRTPTLHEDAINDFIQAEKYTLKAFIDEREAIRLSLKAANLGYSFAEFNVGWIYLFGKKIEKNPQEGVKWMMKSANQENAIAQMVIGALYFSGEHLKRDYIKAYYWTALSAKQGYNLAESRLEKITDKMTPDQLAEVEKIATRLNLAQTW
ncbi:MAG: sel1 repeat family protein [Magnetococcales bacterium]|nr:sel1 repeat family protein [Magnetococcales bacterium]